MGTLARNYWVVKLYIVICVQLFTLCYGAGNVEINNLVAVADLKNDSSNFFHYYNLSRKYADNSLNLSLNYGLKANKIAKGINNKNIAFYNRYNLSQLFLKKLKYSESFYLLKQNYNESYKYRDTLKMLLSNYFIGDFYTKLESFDEAIHYYKSALKLSALTHNNNHTLTLKLKIGNRLADKGKRLLDTTFLYKSIKEYNGNLILSDYFKISTHLPSIYNSLSDAYTALFNLTNNKIFVLQSTRFSRHALESSIQNNNKEGEITSLMNIGEIFKIQNQSDSAITYYLKAMDVKEQKASLAHIIILRDLAIAYLQKKQFDKAIDLIKQSSEIAKRRSEIIELARNYKILSDIYYSKKDFFNAILNLQSYISINKDIAGSDELMRIAKAEAKLELTIKQKEIALLQEKSFLQKKELRFKNKQNLILLFFTITLVVIIAIIIYLYRKKNDLNLEIEKAQLLAEENLKNQEQFLANTSHELRTPLNSIIGYSKLLQENSNDKDRNIYIKNILNSSNALLALINQLLDFSKIKERKVQFESTAFDIRELIATAVSLEELKAKQKGLDLNYNIASNVEIMYLGDSFRLQQVLLNLIDNAIKFTEKGFIKVNVNLLNNSNAVSEIEFKIADTGIGIPEDKLNYIFENFAQASTETSRKYGGSGLGLAICKELIEQQNGTITIESKKDEGSTFTFVLPLTNYKKLAELGVKEAATAHLNNLNILIADDLSLNLNLLKILLTKHGAKVTECNNGIEAINLINNQSFDIVLSDLFMPEMDGFELCKNIRDHSSDIISRLPVIAISAAIDKNTIEKATQHGINLIIAKPYIDDELVRQIKTLTKGVANYKFADFTLMHSKAGEDKDYFKLILDEFINEMPNYLNEINAEIQNEDITKLIFSVHKIKSPILLMGALNISDAYHTIELELRETGFTNEIKDQLKKANANCLILLEEVKAELKRASQ